MRGSICKVCYGFFWFGFCWVFFQSMTSGLTVLVKRQKSLEPQILDEYKE
jgi:hypothetical protein